MSDPKKFAEAPRRRDIELVAVVVDSSIDEQIEVCYCALCFLVQYLLAHDDICSLHSGKILQASRNLMVDSHSLPYLQGVLLYLIGAN